MATIVSIEKAAARRGIAHNYLSNVMVVPPSELVLVDLPLVPGESPRPTLVSVMDRQTTTCRVLLSDAGGVPGSDFHFFADKGAIPAEFKPRTLGDLAGYLARHEELTSQVVMAGGIEHGNLTIARAVHLMLDPQRPLAAGEALQEALEESNACDAWARRTAETARMVAGS